MIIGFSTELLHKWALQVFGGEAQYISLFFEGDGSKFFRLMPSPRAIRETRALKLDVGRALLLFGLPANTQEGPVDSVCFGAGPQAHKKRMAFGGFLAGSVRSARTRNASAVTATSASFLVAPYTSRRAIQELQPAIGHQFPSRKRCGRTRPLAVAAKLPFRNLQVQGERGLVANRIMLSPKS